MDSDSHVSVGLDNCILIQSYSNKKENNLLFIYDSYCELLNSSNFISYNVAYPDFYLLDKNQAIVCDDDSGDAILFNLDKSDSTSIYLGSGVQDIQMDSLGNIWVSYLDTGILDNDSICPEGLCYFSENRQNIAHLSFKLKIIDCYFMNVSFEQVWLYCLIENQGKFNSEIVCISSNRLERYNVFDYHILAFAIRENYALLAFGDGNRVKFAFFKIEKNKMKFLANIEPYFEQIKIEPKKVFARLNIMYIFTTHNLFKIDLKELTL